jgi:NAD(P)-dependent dehydrogenase (short-subunit alcohol dehydrogenase family)
MTTAPNKVVLITGGSSGIGRATAIAFAKARARVVIAARGAGRGEEALRELQSLGADARFVQADVSDSEQVQEMIRETVTAFGRLDCAVNNAAAPTGALSATADFTEQDFDQVVAANLKSVWLCLKFEIQQLLAQQPPRGAIVNVSSINGLGAAANGSLYSACKAGVLALTKAAAQEYAKQGIRVNALVAGAFDTPMLNGLWDGAAGGNTETRTAIEKFYTQLVPLGRVGRPEEAAEAILWLCLDGPSYVTGHSMIVDGGITSPFR